MTYLAVEIPFPECINQPLNEFIFEHTVTGKLCLNVHVRWNDRTLGLILPTAKLLSL